MLYSQYKELDSVIHVCDGNLCNRSPAEETCASAAASYFSDVRVRFGLLSWFALWSFEYYTFAQLGCVFVVRFIKGAFAAVKSALE